MLELKSITKSYKTGEFCQTALKEVSVKFRKSEFVAILGASGSGKTTMLNIIGGLDRYDNGDLIINGKSTKQFKGKDWDAYRNNSIGFIFQNYNLISHISVLDNVEMSMTLSGVSRKEKKKRAVEALEKVGLKDHIHKKPNQLSGGQMQRVAIARALVNNPDIILADEPTGALDSETSVQIMELIKEICSDKLVIMVTHNPELASQYATRIIKLKDGEIMDDSSPCTDEETVDGNYNLRKTSMNFFTALGLSFNNIRTKKGRTFLTAFASSIGIIGIALILSLSNGFDKQIDKFETDTLSQMPIVVSAQTVNMTEDEFKAMADEEKSDIEEFSDDEIIRPLKTAADMIHENHITKEYVEYIEDIDDGLISGLQYTRATKLNLMYKIKDEITMPDVSMLFVSLPESASGGTKDTIIEKHFEVIKGKLPSAKEDLLLLVDSKNRVNSSVLEMLGYEKTDEITFEDLLNKEFKVAMNEDLYKEANGYFMMNTDYEELYKSENSITLKISGIIRGKEDDDFSKYSGTGIIYKTDLINYVIEENEKSDVVKTQREKDYNVLTGEKFNVETEEGKTAKENFLAYLGDDCVPMVIQIYPNDFDLKEELIEYLDDFNKEKSTDEKVIYVDYSATISSLSGGIMDAITWVLIGFSAISLIVSTIMIAIITYISVLERTKEIGVLRAIGARKKDITRVFNAETFIIGLFSGVLGLLIAQLLIVPINILLENLTDLKNVAQTNPLHAIVLIIISVALTLLGGWIPAKIASRKDPVEALRTE